MKGAFSIFIFLLFASLVSAQFPQDLYRIKLEYNNGTVTLKNVSSIFSYFQETKNQPENSYKIQIENSNGNTLFQEKFNFPLILTDPYAILDNAEKTLYAPCTKDSFKLKVFYPSNEKLLEKRNGKVLLLGERGGLFNTDWKISSKVILESNLKVGKIWKNEKSAEDIDECKVISISDEVSVAAGNFKDVLVIDKTESYIDSKSKKKILFLKKREYYAPNIGLIKTEILIRSKNTYEVITELVDYKL